MLADGHPAVGCHAGRVMVTQEHWVQSGPSVAHHSTGSQENNSNRSGPIQAFVLLNAGEEKEKSMTPSAPPA